MKNIITSFAAGALFALGLGISGMTQPTKVVGFLDVFGNWDPSLLFVIICAIAVHLVAYKLILKRKSPLFSDTWHLPTKTDITPSLLVGSMIFGLGWGLGGYCPGPAVVAMASLDIRPIFFAGSMIAGMAACNILVNYLTNQRR